MDNTIKDEKGKGGLCKDDKKMQEIDGYKGQEPTTHGDWQHKGRVSDF